MTSKVKSHSGAKILLAGCALMALSSAAWADQIHVGYTLAAGASVTVTVPAVNTPVSMTCVNNSSGNRGVGQATLLRVSPAAFLEWVGSDIATGAISTGFSATAGTHIIYCDYTGKLVDVQVLNSSDIQIKNTSTVTMTGELNFVY